MPRTRLAATALAAFALCTLSHPRPATAQLAPSYWPVFQQNAQHTGQSPVDGPATSHVSWIFQGA